MLSNVKKPVLPLMTLLVANQEATVASLMPDLMALAVKNAKGESSPRVATSITNNAGECVAILDYYFKRWMPLVGDEAVVFGKKANSHTGYSTMCKEGTSLWTKQQRLAKQAISDLLVKLESGELAAEDISEAKQEIESTRVSIEETDLGFVTKDEVVTYLTDAGVDVTSGAEA